MVVNTSDPKIPPALREAFDYAVALLLEWEGGDEPQVVLEERPTSISSVFLRTTGFDDLLPGSVLRKVLQCARGSDDVVELIKDRSYGRAARLLFRLTDAKKA